MGGREGLAVPRVCMLAADGLDPNILQQLIGQGQLPHFRRLMERGFFAPMSTTYPPVSPVAWTSLLTGCWPAKHGILDFIIKAPSAYSPTLGLYEIEMGPTGEAYHSRRRVPLLSEILHEHGMESRLLYLPGTFPPPKEAGHVLSGFGTPDLFGTFGSPALYVEGRASPPKERRRHPFVHPLHPNDGQWCGEIQAPPGGVGVSFTIQETPDGIRLQCPAFETEALLAEGRWSRWISLEFAGERRPAGICRFYLLSRRPLTLYRSVVHHDPHRPAVPLSSPADFAPWLAQRMGRFPTASFPMEQAGYQERLLPAEPFLAGAYTAWEEQLRLAEHLLAAGGAAFLAVHLFTADCAQHFFWPDAGGRVTEAYRWLDTALGRLADAAGEDAVLMVVSDHGAVPIHCWVHLNRWLADQGYLLLRPDGRIDWRRTRAFCLGYGGIYLNVRGREPAGMVEPGRPYEELRRRLIAELQSLHNPATGEPVVEWAQPREAWHAGPLVQDMPDIILAFRPGYGLAHEDARGECPGSTPWLEPNHGRWKAGHEGPYAPTAVRGVFLAAGPGIRPGQGENVDIVDVLPTLCQLWGIPASAHLDGRPIPLGAG